MILCLRITMERRNQYTPTHVVLRPASYARCHRGGRLPRRCKSASASSTSANLSSAAERQLRVILRGQAFKLLGVETVHALRKSFSWRARRFGVRVKRGNPSFWNANWMVLAAIEI